MAEKSLNMMGKMMYPNIIDYNIINRAIPLIIQSKIYFSKLVSDSDQFKSSQPPARWVTLKLTNPFIFEKKTLKQVIVSLLDDLHVCTSPFESACTRYILYTLQFPSHIWNILENCASWSRTEGQCKCNASEGNMAIMKNDPTATALKFNLIPWSKPVSRHFGHGAIMWTYFKNTTHLTYMSSLFFLICFLALNIKHFTQND